MSKEQIKINIDELTEIALLGVQRSAAFMGFGLNAASKEDFNDYELHKLPKFEGQTSFPIDFLPTNLSDEQVRELKKHFGLWIITCGFREILEHYAMFLDHIHETCLLIACKNGSFSNEDAQKTHSKFVGNLGIPGKLDKLEQQFRIKPDNSQSIKQLYNVRNALTHDLGQVTQKRCGSGESLHVSWRAFDILAIGEETGLQIHYSDLIGRKTNEPLNIVMKFQLREKYFSVGSSIHFSQQDLWEICFFFSSIAIPSTKKCFINYLTDHGVTIQKS